MNSQRKIVNLIRNKISKFFFGPEKWIRSQVANGNHSYRRLGTNYGGWDVLIDNSELRDGIAILCGAGEDISFDLSLQKLSGCRIFIIDPTPRAIAHYGDMLDAVDNKIAFPINGSTSEFYDFNGVDFGAIQFIPVAIWSENTVLKFWKPKDVRFVSHSATNLQKTSEYIEVSAKDLETISTECGVTLAEVSLLKLDVEGAEVEVLEWCLENEFLPKQLLIEFDELNFPSRRSGKKVVSIIKRLLLNYELVTFDGRSNCLFVRR